MANIRFMPSSYDKINLVCLCVFEGDPVTWARPAGTFRRYDTQVQIKRRLGWIVKKEMKGQKPAKGPLLVEVLFFIKPPKTVKNRTKYPIFKKDIDNLQKLLLDSCNTIAWVDDGQIIDIHARKLWAGKRGPETIMSVWEIE